MAGAQSFVCVGEGKVICMNPPLSWTDGCAGEVDVLECADKKALEKCVKKHDETSRGETGCCGCGKSGVLADWEWVESLDEARKIIQ